MPQMGKNVRTGYSSLRYTSAMISLSAASTVRASPAASTHSGTEGLFPDYVQSGDAQEDEAAPESGDAQKDVPCHSSHFLLLPEFRLTRFIRTVSR